MSMGRCHAPWAQRTLTVQPRFKTWARTKSLWRTLLRKNKVLWPSVNSWKSAHKAVDCGPIVTGPIGTGPIVAFQRAAGNFVGVMGRTKMPLGGIPNRKAAISLLWWPLTFLSYPSYPGLTNSSQWFIPIDLNLVRIIVRPPAVKSYHTVNEILQQKNTLYH